MAYYQPAPRRTDGIPERDLRPRDNGYKSVFTNYWLVRQRHRSWIKGLGKNPQKEWTRSLFAVPFVRGHPPVTPQCIHVNRHDCTPRVACLQVFRQKCVFRCSPLGGMKIICVFTRHPALNKQKIMKFRCRKLYWPIRWLHTPSCKLIIKTVTQHFINLSF